MEVLVLDSNFQGLTLLEAFESLIWTERFCAFGDFEVYAPIDAVILNALKYDNYLWVENSDYVMVVEDWKIVTDPVNGNKISVTGRSLESILDRRIIWKQTILSGNFQTEVERLLNENAISPEISARHIPNLIFEASTDPIITALTIDTQFTGDNLYDAIQVLCAVNDIGFHISLSDNGSLVFKLYSGTDRSYAQFLNPHVIFSNEFENIDNGTFIGSTKSLKTVTLVAGEGEGVDRKTTSVDASTGAGEGLTRRELFTDARDISSTTDSGTLTPADYLILLSQRGTEKLSLQTTTESFDGQIEPSTNFKYGVDFFLGDIVQIENEYGMESRTRVVETIRSQNVSGIEVYPTFRAI